jgi:hypothetical protein
MSLSEQEELELLELEEQESKSKPATIPIVSKTTKPMFGLPPVAENALFPTAASMPREGFVSEAKKGAVGAIDLLGAPVRALAKARGMNMSDPNAALFRPEIEKVKSKIDQYQPNASTSIPTSPLEFGQGRQVSESAGKKVLKGTAASDPTILFSVIKSLIKKPVKFLAKQGNKLAGATAEELSGVPEKSLRMYGKDKASRQAIKAAADSQLKIADDMLNAIDDVDSYLPERTIINESLKNMPPIKTDKLINTLENSKINAVTAGAKAGNKKIDDLINNIRSSSSNRTKIVSPIDGTVSYAGGDIPADTYRNLRIQFDNELRAAWDKDYKDYIEKAMTKARTTMKNDLVDAAKASGNDSYAGAMESYAKKLDAVDQLKKYVGKSSDSRSRRIESFVSNLFNKNNSHKQQVVKELGDVFGQDFLGQSELARIAQDLGPGGVPRLLPAQTTGRSLLGLLTAAPTGGASLALTSPKTAAYTLGTLDKLAPFLSNVNKATNKVVPYGLPTVAKSVQNLYNEDRNQALKRASE